MSFNPIERSQGTLSYTTQESNAEPLKQESNIVDYHAQKKPKQESATEAATTSTHQDASLRWKSPKHWKVVEQDHPRGLHV